MNARHLLIASSLTLLSQLACASEDPTQPGNRWVEVSGSGVHRFSSAIVHSVTETEVGFVQRSTETVELSGDLEGRILYHPVSVFDFAAGTLVNTGHQVFSGQVLGMGPVLLHDDEFRFDVNLGTGETFGRVFLENRLNGPDIRCHLEIVGVGAMDEQGDALVDYTGSCRVRQLMPARERIR
ncbi:hypothetical protein [Wenzhouxiangella marina]|uniref:Uncharacterized protein n=1 Tax=Wenzhouxiangella marina TaxID=1579979 RepID=A0A0K0XYY8_9GAMM|nr:hypothetical protein [Wenzhouxiangella marina]AKS42885.1 hypothetical protein WM2015_2527 [Wenzhouxiangella marina]MBB6087432.1 hypothetical protein [Wenzhouxiangella marina]